MAPESDQAPPHLVHGMGTDLEAPSWPMITGHEAHEVLAAFPQAGRLEGLGWHSPRPFSAATLVATSSGDLFLKRHHRSVRDVEGLAAEHAFIAHLAARGMPVVEVLQTGAGATALTLGEWTWEVHRKADGLDLYRERQSWTPWLTDGHARAGGAALARLHRAAQDFAAPARSAQSLLASLTILTCADPLAGAERYIRARPALADYLADKDWRATLARLFAVFEVDRLAPALAAEAAIWTHNDWHPSNLLWTPDGGVATVLDFGLSDRTCALHDLATALERSAVRWLELGGLELGGDAAIGDPVAARALLAGYCAVRPLTAPERDLLVRLVPVVHLEFALSEIAYFHGVVGRRDYADLAWHDYLIGHAEWFLTASGRALLAEVGSL